MGVDKLRDIIVLLRRMHGRIDPGEFIATRVRSRGFFEFIVGVMLSQNTSDKNAIRAYEGLKKLLGGRITPEAVLSRSPEEIAEAIRPAGMYNQRARRIVELAEIFHGIGEEELVLRIRGSSLEEARRILTDLPGVGVKTADVVLLMYFGKPTFPVDTHITRITRRLGVLERYSYEDIRRFWMNVLDEKDYLEGHLLLITHGRRICKARNPLCSRCLLRSFCSYWKRGIEEKGR